MRQLVYGRDPRLRTSQHPGQALDTQLAALIASGVNTDRIFTDKLSGSAKATRSGLGALLEYVRAGDTVVVTAIDRLGRSVAEVTRTMADFGERGIVLRALREAIDTATPTGRAVAGIMATGTRTWPRTLSRIARSPTPPQHSSHQTAQAQP